MFRPEHVHQFREQHPDIKILVHPECPQEVNDLADISGSTGKIIETVEQSAPRAPNGRSAQSCIWSIGLKAEHPEQEIHFLSPVVCMCATMYRIDLAHLCWSLENLAAGTPVNVIEVDDETCNVVTGRPGANAAGPLVPTNVELDNRTHLEARISGRPLRFGLPL